MSETSSRVRLMANLQAAVAEAVSGTMEERGRGFASDREAWAELKECIERTKQMHTDIEKSSQGNVERGQGQERGRFRRTLAGVRAEFPYSRRGMGANVRPCKNRRYQRVERLRRSHK